MRSKTLLLLTCLIFVGLREQRTLAEAHWSQFRGPHGDGVARDGVAGDAQLPVSFSESQNVRWKVAVAGVGWSSPVVWDDQIWLTRSESEGQRLYATCFDVKSGEQRFNVKVFDVRDPRREWSDQNPHACATPVVEAGRLYVHFGSFGTACVETATGKVLWRRDDFKCNHRVGPASSPILDGDRLVLQFDGVDLQYVVALDKHTGETIWKTARRAAADLATRLRERGLAEAEVKSTLAKKPGDNRKSYATATSIEHQGRRQLLCPAAEVLYSYDPANGEELWRVEYPGWAWNVACKPVYANGLVYVTSGLGKELWAIRPDGSGDVTETHVVWRSKRGVPNISSPLVHDGTTVIVSDNGGIVTSLRASDGRQLARKRIGGDHWASPILSGDHYFFCSKQGVVDVLKVTPDTIEVVATNRMRASFIASPAVAGNSLVLRSTTHLYCLANGVQRSPDLVAADVYPDTEESSVAADSSKPRRKKRKKDGEQQVDWEQAYEELLAKEPGVREKIAKGYATKADVIAYLKMQRNKNARQMGKASEGKHGFYAIVIGRMLTKDVELGEFNLQVDYVTSMYDNRWVKDEIVGKQIKVTGVSGPFLDQLFLIKSGETLKLRTGTYSNRDGVQQLTFGEKFKVLERAKPFAAEEYGVPSDSIRGFAGEVRGKIVELGGFEVLLAVDQLLTKTEQNEAAEPKHIEGKRIRIVGFYIDHDDAFGNLHVGDTICVGVEHRNRKHDEFHATQRLEVVDE